MSLLSKILKRLVGSNLEKKIEEIELDLLEANVSPAAIEKLKDLIKTGKSVREAVLSLLKAGYISNERVIMIVGVNGSGKTTMTAKLAHMLMKKGKRVVVAAADTFRAGSIEQLEEWKRIVGFDLVKYHYGADPAAVAYEAVKKGGDVVLIDTAGRQETRSDLMKELKKIKEVAKPDLTLMVVDATQGLAAVEQAKGFHRSVGIDGFLITKMDIDEKGGIILSLSSELEKPVFYISFGQDLDSIKPFDPEEYVDNLLGSS